MHCIFRPPSIPCGVLPVGAQFLALEKLSTAHSHARGENAKFSQKTLEIIEKIWYDKAVVRINAVIHKKLSTARARKALAGYYFFTVLPSTESK